MSSDPSQRESVLLEEIPMRMRRGNAPEVIHQNIEHTQNSYQNHSGILGLKPDDNHEACQKSRDSNDRTGPSILASMEKKAKEE